MTLVNVDTGEVVSERGPLHGTMTATGYELPDGLSFDEWAAEGTVLLSMARSCMWWVGDWIRYGEQRYGEMYAQAIETTGLGYQTVRNAVWVAERYPIEERRAGLAFEHHVRAASLEMSVRTDILDKAEANGWTTRDVADEVRRIKAHGKVLEAKLVAGAEHFNGEVIEDLATAERIYSAVVIDPPWRYDNRATRNNAEGQYKQEDGRDETTMSQADLLKLEIPAADNAHLYLWVTNSFMRDGFELMEEWGFKYKTCLTWCKPQIGMGNYFRSTTEHVLFGMRGSLPTLRNNVPTHFVADRRHHSAKPESFFDLVESCSPGPYLEMFARRRRFGWHVWGNEA